MTLPTPRLIAELGEIYEMYRTSALNKSYYGALLARYQRFNTALEIAIAVGATSSGVSGLALWSSTQGKVIWGTIAAVSSVLAVAKPILQLNKTVERYSKLFTGHLENYLALRALVTKIRRREALSKEMIQEFELAEQRFIDLSRGDDPRTIARIHKTCEAEVRLAIPDTMLWMPRASKTPRKRKAPRKSSSLQAVAAE